MKRHTLLILVFTWTHLMLQAQEVYKEFGMISPDEYKLTSHPTDSAAEAVVLYDMGSSRFNSSSRGFEIHYERATRIKIFTEAGLKWAEIEIPFYREGDIYEEIYELEAISYVFENGVIKKIPLDLKNTYTEKLNESWQVRKFALPNIKPGSIIEYRYKIVSQYILHLREWYFQWSIPVLYSAYTTSMVPFYEYSYIVQGTKKEEIELTSSEDNMNTRYFANVPYHDLSHKFVRKNIPAFRSEDYISSVDDYIAKIIFQLSKVNYPQGGSEQIMSTWENLIDNLLKNDDFGKFVSKATKAADKVFDLNNLRKKPEQEKFDEVIDYVKNNFLWNQRNGIYATKSPSKLMEEKAGNAADINLFAVGLLNSAGIKSYPMLISTRRNGKIMTDYPFLTYFNYVVILSLVDGRTVMTDATDVLARNERISEKCINDAGLVIDRENPRWVNTEPAFPSLITTSLNMDIRNPGEISVELIKVLNEYDALRFKQLYAEKKEKIIETFERDNIAVNDSSLQMGDPLKRSRSLYYKYRCNYKPDYINGKVYIAPFLYETLRENPLKEKERTYPVDFTYMRSEQFTCRIKVPAGYRVDYLPAKTVTDNNLFSLSYLANVRDDVIDVSMSYLFKKSFYLPEEYQQIKKCLNELVEKSTEKIVLASSLSSQ